jgi:hypothetical protein
MRVIFTYDGDLMFDAAMKSLMSMSREQRRKHIIESVKFYMAMAKMKRQAEKKLTALEAVCV